MVSLRLLGVLSVVALLHSTTLAEDVPKCEDYAWHRNGNGPVAAYDNRKRKEVPCKSGVCFSYSVRFENITMRQWIRGDAACLKPARPLTASYECESVAAMDGKYFTTQFKCLCKAGTDSLCNRAELMYDPEGDDGQKSRALDLRKIGIIADAKTTDAGRKITLRFDDDFGKTTIEPTPAPTAEAATTAVEDTTTVPEDATVTEDATVPEEATVTDEATVPEQTTAEQGADGGNTTIETPEAVVTPSSDPSSITGVPSDAGNPDDGKARGGDSRAQSGKLPRARDDDVSIGRGDHPESGARNGFALLSMASVWMFIR